MGDRRDDVGGGDDVVFGKVGGFGEKPAFAYKEPRFEALPAPFKVAGECFEGCGGFWGWLACNERRCGGGDGGDGGVGGGSGGGVGLLDDVGEFVGEELAACAGGWCVATSGEEDVLSGGKGVCADLVTEVLGGAVGVKAYVGEIDAEAWFKEGAQVIVQGLPLAAGVVEFAFPVVVDRWGVGCVTFWCDDGGGVVRSVSGRCGLVGRSGCLWGGWDGLVS